MFSARRSYSSSTSCSSGESSSFGAVGSETVVDSEGSIIMLEVLNQYRAPCFERE